MYTENNNLEKNISKISVSKLLKIISKLEKDQNQYEKNINDIFSPSKNNCTLQITNITNESKFKEFVDSKHFDDSIKNTLLNTKIKRENIYKLKLILRDANNSMDMESNFAKHSKLTKLIEFYKNMLQNIENYQLRYSNLNKDSLEEYQALLTDDSRQVCCYKQVSNETKQEIIKELNYLNKELNDLNDTITTINHTKMVEIPSEILNEYNNITM